MLVQASIRSTTLLEDSKMPERTLKPDDEPFGQPSSMSQLWLEAGALYVHIKDPTTKQGSINADC